MKSSVSKNISTEISDITNFLNDKTFIIQNDDHIVNDCFFKTLGNEKGINFSIELKDWITTNEIGFNKLGFNKDFQIVSKSEAYIVPSNSVNKIKSKIGFVKELKGSLMEIYDKKFPIIDQSNFRLFIKTKQHYIPNIFLGSGYNCNGVHYALGLTQVETNQGLFHIYRHNEKNNDDTYLIIESLNRISFTDFHNISESILKSFGFLSGTWLRGEHYYFAYNSIYFENKSSIYYKHTGNSILNNYEIINPREFKNFINSDKKEFTLVDVLFPEEILSKIISSIVEKTEYERAIDLLIEGNTALTPLVRASVFSVALETIIVLIEKENKLYFQSIKSTKSILSTIEKIKKNLEDEKQNLTEEDYSFLLNKFNNLSTPTNKDKFLLSFKLFKIHLPTELQNLLAKRNKFFHGKTPYPENSYKNRTKDFNLEADRLHMLVSILLLKYVGYKGHIKNQAGYRVASSNYFLETNNNSDESPFYRI